eukprot:gene3154-biopygen18684
MAPEIISGRCTRDLGGVPYTAGPWATCCGPAACQQQASCGLSGIFGMFRGPARKSAPRAARPPPPGPGARRGRMGPEFRTFRNLPQVEARYLKSPAFAPRSESPHARAKWGPMIRVASGSSLAFQRQSRASLFSILGAWVAETDFAVAPSGLA